MLSNMFGLGISVIEKMCRPILVYLFLMIGLRLAGKRELAQLNAMDLIVLMMLANTVQNATIGDDNTVIGGLIGAGTLLLTNYLIVRFLYSHERIDRIVEGEPDALIENGVLRPERLKKELLTQAELEIAAHKQGFGSLADVDLAVLEAGGVITFIAKKPLPETVRQTELTARLDQILRELADLKAAVAARE